VTVDRPFSRAQRHIARTPHRRTGYLPIRDYAAIGDGRTVALVGLDGAVDWLCLPNMDSPSAFGALLDPDKGGSFELEPAEPYQAARRYSADSNVLETTFESAGGVARVTDALTSSGETSGGTRELVRRIEGLSGTVPMRWRARPRLGYGLAETVLDIRSERPVAVGEQGIVSLSSWDAGEPTIGNGAIDARFELRDGSRALLVLGFDEGRSFAIPGRDDAEARLEATRAFWQQWAAERSYEGPWRDHVLRSALVLKLLISARTGAIAAAPTTSLPEVPGGDFNWDYRFCWGRDSSFVADSLLELLDLVKLPREFAERRPRQLSGGQKQRVGLARAFATNADILLMDEPFSALDPLIRRKLQDELLALQERVKKTILFVSHDLDEALKLGDTVTILEGGHIVQTGSGRDIVEHPADDYVAEFVQHVNPRTAIKGTASA